MIIFYFVRYDNVFLLMYVKSITKTAKTDKRMKIIIRDVEYSRATKT
jgi:hypothetical protein